MTLERQNSWETEELIAGGVDAGEAGHSIKVTEEQHPDCLDQEWFTITNKGSQPSFSLTSIQGHYKKIGKNQWKRKGRVWMCCPVCACGKRAYLRYTSSNIRSGDHLELATSVSKGVWNISFYSASGGFDHWLLFSDNTDIEGKWYWQSQKQASLRVEMGKQNLCCCARGTQGSLVSCLGLPFVILLVVTVSFFIQVLTLSFLFAFGVLFLGLFYIMTCCFDARDCLDHEDLFYAKHINALTSSPLFPEKTSKKIKDKIGARIISFTPIDSYPGWYSLHLKSRCNIFPSFAGPLIGHYERVGWMNGQPIYKKWGKIYTWGPQFRVRETVWLYYSGDNRWLISFEPPEERQTRPPHVLYCNTSSYGHKQTLSTIDIWHWDDKEKANVKLNEGRDWIIGSVCCPSLCSLGSFLLVPAIIVFFFVLFFTASFFIFALFFAPVLVLLVLYCFYLTCRLCCKKDDSSENLLH